MRATVKLVNEIGFVSSSVSKIAKEAGVSPATIYIYYKNKEDLLVSTYVDIKKNVSTAVMKEFDSSLPIRDIFRNVWFNLFDYISRHTDEFQFKEQFANSPYMDLVDHEEVEKYFIPLIEVLQRGIDQKIIKNVSHDLLVTFMFYPVMILSNPRLNPLFEHTEESIDTAFTLAWDAVKL